MEADSNQVEREEISVTVSQELVPRGDKVEYRNNGQNYPEPNYGLPLIPFSDKHHDVIIPGTNTFSPHYDSHTPKKARKKPLYLPAITKARREEATAHTDDECVCVSVPCRKIMDQEKNPSLSSREDPSTRFKRYMRAFHKTAKHDIIKFGLNKGQKTPGSEVQTNEPKAARILNMTNKSKESTIYEQESVIAAEDSQIDLVTPAKGHSYFDTSPAKHLDRHNSTPSDLRSQKPSPISSSDSNAMVSEVVSVSLDSRLQLSDSPEDLIKFLKPRIHEAALTSKGFRPDEITLSNLEPRLKGNRAQMHPNLSSELIRRNIRMVRTNNFI